MHSVRRARPADAIAISELDGEVFPGEGLNEVTFERELRNGSKGFVARCRSGTELSGFVLYRPGHVGDVLRLAVREGNRGWGLGSKLLGLALAAGAMRGPVILTVRKDNPGASRLYERHGFRAVGELAGSWVMRRG